MFSNYQVDIDQLPSIKDIDYQSLQKEYLNVELIATSIFWALVALVLIIVLFIVDVIDQSWLKYLILFGTMGLAILSYVIVLLQFRRKKFALREHDIIYSSGLVWRQKTVVPFNRIQHVEVTEGPIDRLFDLSKLNIYTAGGSSSDLTVPGLIPSRAESIKHYILNKNRQLDEEE